MNNNSTNAIRLSGVFLILLLTISCTSTKKSTSNVPGRSKEPVYITHIQIDTMFHGNQKINLLIMRNQSPHKLAIDIGYNKRKLKTTSQIAENHHAIAAINGSFFDEDHGGSVTYFEKNDSVISTTRPADIKWALPDSLINGAVIMTKKHQLKIQKAKSDLFYEKSGKEAFVLVSGPLLIYNGKIQKLPNMKFSNNRHPRTCLCITKRSLIFITIDGRQKQADGMTLHEAQKYLLGMGCVNAINLDGGGSSTMWTKEKGIVNKPSDKKGERPVANALLIKKKH